MDMRFDGRGNGSANFWIVCAGALLCLHAQAARSEAARPVPPYDLRGYLHECFLGAVARADGYDVQILLTFYFHNRGTEPVVVRPGGYGFDSTNQFPALNDKSSLPAAFAITPGEVHRYHVHQIFHRRFFPTVKRAPAKAGLDAMDVFFGISGLPDPERRVYVGWPFNKLDYRKYAVKGLSSNMEAFEEDCFTSHRLYYSKGAPAEPSSEKRPADWELANGEVKR